MGSSVNKWSKYITVLYTARHERGLPSNKRCKYTSNWVATADYGQLMDPSSPQRGSPTRTEQQQTSGHERQTGLDTKTLTDPQSNWRTPPLLKEGTPQGQNSNKHLVMSTRQGSTSRHWLTDWLTDWPPVTTWHQVKLISAYRPIHSGFACLNLQPSRYMWHVCL
jgi:hypothetical protein